MFKRRLAFALATTGIALSGAVTASAQTAIVLPPEVKVRPIDLSSLRPQHPRLFADTARLQAIKTQTDPVSRDLIRLVMQHAEAVLSEPEMVYPPAASNTEYPGPGGKFVAVRTVQGRVLSLALAYRLSGDARFFARARQELLQMAAVPDWNPKHFLTLSETAFTVAVGYDWLYEQLSAQDRDTLAQAIKTKALRPSLDARPSIGGGDANRSWLDGNYNWNPVVNGGLAVAALAIADREPELARTIIGRSVHYIPYAAAAYDPDGAWPEAPNYWTYGTSYYIIAVEALRTALGSDFGLAAHRGVRKTGDYKVQVRGATGEEWNYSDYTLERENSAVMLWLANETRRPELASDETTTIGRLARQEAPDPGLIRNRHTPLELLWWNPAVAQTRQRALPTEWLAQGDTPLGVMRTAWNNPNATFVAIKGGSPSYSHAHMDGGSFVMEAGGVRWAVDLSAEPYDNMRRVKIDLWNMGQDSGRWTTFRLGSDGHNILRFDNDRQMVNGNGKLAALPKTAGARGYRADLTSLYAERATDVTRIISLVRDGAVDVRDSWTLRERAATTTFQWLTLARPVAIPGGVRLSQAGKTLELKVAAPSNAEIVIEDASKPRLPQDSAIPGLSRLLFRTKTPAGGKGSFHVTARLIE